MSQLGHPSLPGGSQPTGLVESRFTYTAHFVDRLGLIIARTKFTALNDTTAIIYAIPFSKTHMIEVRQEGRLIARIPKDSMGFGPVARSSQNSISERTKW